MVEALLLSVGFEDSIHVELSVGYSCVEVRHNAVTEFRHRVHQDGFFVVQLLVLHLALQFLFGQKRLSALHLFEALTHFCPCTRRSDDVEPVLLGRLVAVGQDFHLVAALQLLPDGDILASDASPYTLVAHFRVDVISEVEHSSTHRQFEDIAFWGEDKNLILPQIEAELVHQLGIVVCLQSASHASQPFFYAALSALHALVPPMSSKAVLSNIVHALCAYLYLYPLLFRAEYRDVQTLVAVAFGDREPVAHTFRVALVHVRDDAEHLPAFHLLALGR